MPPKILVVDDNAELLALLTQLFEDAGYQVLPAAKGRAALELAKANAPRAALLDVLLPDMMGYQLAEGLRKDQPDLPIIFLTGVFKGGRHAAEAMQKHRAAAYFEKPFDSAKLIEAMAALVPPEKKAAASSIEEAFDVDVEIEDAPEEPMELTGRVRVTGDDNISAELRGQTLTAKSLAPVKRKMQASPPAAAPPPATAAPKPTGARRSGQLKDNLPALINAFYLAGETGQLGIQRGKVKKVVTFEKGQPVSAVSNLAADRFGQFLVRVGKISPEVAQRAADEAAKRKCRTGDVLIEQGLLKETERLYYVGQQVKAIIYSLFGWEDGT
jgi:CheY-like chemotaxis protein